MQQGTVIEWNERGYGFISVEDGLRAYVHNSVCNGEHLTQGESVSAFLAEDPVNPGKWQATVVVRGAASAPVAQRASPPQYAAPKPVVVQQPGMFQGSVVEWNE